MNYHDTIAKNIKRLSKKKGINYSEIARRAGIQLNRLQIILYRKNRTAPRIDTVHAIAKALKVSIDELLKQ